MWSASANLSVHWKGVEGLSKCRNGDMAAVIEKAYDTWFMRPNHALTSVMLFGVGKSLTAAVNLSAVRTSVGVIVNPANSTSSSAKWNLRGFRVMPSVAHMCSHSAACASVMSVDHSNASSMHFVLFRLMSAAVTAGSVPSGTAKVQSGMGQFTAMPGGRQLEKWLSLSLSLSLLQPAILLVRLTGLS